MSQYQNDFGLGLNISTPYFINNTMALRLRGNLMFMEHLNQVSETTWTNYSNAQLGWVVKAGTINESIVLYGEGGLVALFPSVEFSSETVNLGGYGQFGVEFFFYEHFNYFFEIGGMGTGAKADKVENSPIYSNGLMVNVGFRAKLWLNKKL